MLRSALLAIALVLSPADYTQCVRHDNGPILRQGSPAPFARKPDFAAMSAYPRTLYFDGMPPERFRGPRTMNVQTGSVAVCGKAPPGYTYEGCVDGDTVHLPNPCDFPEQSFARLLCHEQAHLWGWPEDHGP